MLALKEGPPLLTMWYPLSSLTLRITWGQRWALVVPLHYSVHTHACHRLLKESLEICIMWIKFIWTGGFVQHIFGMVGREYVCHGVCCLLPAHLPPTILLPFGLKKDLVPLPSLVKRFPLNLKSASICGRKEGMPSCHFFFRWEKGVGWSYLHNMK